MTELNQSTLRGILASILSVDPKYIVPKQGNWWNPQEAEKPDTWCAYIIRSNTPRTAPFYVELNGQQTVCVQKIATIDLQFVGQQSEEIAQSISAWALRSDVQEQFKTVGGAILYDGLEARSVNFYQDGTNNILSWNVTIRVIWTQTINANQSVIKTIETGGQINVR